MFIDAAGRTPWLLCLEGTLFQTPFTALAACWVSPQHPGGFRSKGTSTFNKETRLTVTYEVQTISNGHEGNQFAKYVYGYNKGKSGWLPHMIVSTEKSTAFAIRFHSLTSCVQHTKLNGRIALVTDRTPSKVCVLLLPENRRLSTSWTNVLPLDKIVMYDFLKSTPGCGKKSCRSTSGSVH